MKNEERIIELLAEYLKKTDQSLARSAKLEKRMDLAYDAIVKYIAELVDLRKESGEVRWETVDLRKETGDLRKETVDLRKEMVNLKKETVDLRKETVDLRKETVDLRKEMVDLRKGEVRRDVQQEALLKEIFSISKRVFTLEEKKR